MDILEAEDYIRENFRVFESDGGRKIVHYVFIFKDDHVKLYYAELNDDGITKHTSYTTNFAVSSNFANDIHYTFISDVDYFFPNYTDVFIDSYFGCNASAFTDTEHELTFVYSEDKDDDGGVVARYWHLSDNGNIGSSDEFYVDENVISGAGVYSYSTTLRSDSVSSLGDAQNIVLSDYVEEGYPNESDGAGYDMFAQILAVTTCLLSKGQICCIKRCFN